MSNENSISSNSSPFVENVPVKAKVWYSLANMGNGMLSGLGLNNIMFFYSDILKMDSSLQGIVWLIFAAWNAINDPILGILEEKTKSKLGRRVPYLRYGAGIYALLFLIIWFPFAPIGNQTLLFLNLLLMLFLFDTAYSMIGLITYSLPAEMAITSKERSSIMIYSTVFGVGSQVVSLLLPALYLSSDNFDLGVWQLVCTFIAIGSGLLIWASSYFITENRWAQKEPTLGFWESIKETIKNREFLVFEVMNYALLICQTILISGITYLMKYVLVGGLTIASFPYLIPIVVMLVVSIILMIKSIGKRGLKKTFIIGMAIGGIGFAILPLFGRTIADLSIPLMFICVALATMIMCGQPLIADVIDYDEVLTGKRRETTYSGVNALITKPAISIANWGFLAILVKFGYDETVSVQPASVGDGVVTAYSVIPVITIIIAIIAIMFFKLDGPEWIKKKHELQMIHEQKEKAFVESLMKEGKLTTAPN